MTISTETPGVASSVSASETSGLSAPKSNWRWRRDCWASAAARAAAFAPRPFGSARNVAPESGVAAESSVSRGNARDSFISASLRTSSAIAASKSSARAPRRT